MRVVTRHISKRPCYHQLQLSNKSTDWNFVHTALSNIRKNNAAISHDLVSNDLPKGYKKNQLHGSNYIGTSDINLSYVRLISLYTICSFVIYHVDLIKKKIKSISLPSSQLYEKALKCGLVAGASPWLMDIVLLINNTKSLSVASKRLNHIFPQLEFIWLFLKVQFCIKTNILVYYMS